MHKFRGGLVFRLVRVLGDVVSVEDKEARACVASGVWVLGFGFWDLNLGFGIWGLGFGVSGLGADNLLEDLIPEASREVLQNSADSAGQVRRLVERERERESERARARERM